MKPTYALGCTLDFNSILQKMIGGQPMKKPSTDQSGTMPNFDKTHSASIGPCHRTFRQTEAKEKANSQAKEISPM